MVKKILSIFLISLSINSNCFCDSGNDVIFLSKDQKVPFNGYLFTEEKTQTLKNSVVERDGLKLINTSLQKSLDLSNSNILLTNDKNKLLEDQNNSLATSLYKERSSSTLEKFVWFGLGIFCAGLGVWGVKQVTK